MVCLREILKIILCFFADSQRRVSFLILRLSNTCNWILIFLFIFVKVKLRNEKPFQIKYWNFLITIEINPFHYMLQQQLTVLCLKCDKFMFFEKNLDISNSQITLSFFINQRKQFLRNFNATEPLFYELSFLHNSQVNTLYKLS